MQPVSTYYTAEAVRKIRKVGQTCLVSWLKTYDSNLNFFSIGQSSIGGSDIIKGYENTVLEWDKYNYIDESKYVVDFEYDREFIEHGGGAVKSRAYVTLDNYSDRFTEGYDGTIGSYILPKRPVKLFVKFGTDSCPVFVGQTEKTPEQNYGKKLVKMHMVDYLDYLNNYPLDETVIKQNQRTDQLIEYLLQAVGLGLGQYTLDVGILNIPFAIFPKGEKVGTILRQIVQAEMGNMYQDENGYIVFENRHHGLSAEHQKVRYTFDHTNILNIKAPTDQNVINTVEVRGEARAVQDKQGIFSSTTAIFIPASSTKEVWADYTDPVTSVDTVIDYTAYDNEDGSGTDRTANISISAQSNFAQSSKITFSNNLGSGVWITAFTVTGTPVKVISKIEGKATDATSISKYDERVLTITNPFIQNNSDAQTLSQIICDQYKDPAKVKELEIRGMPYLQLGDRITVNWQGTSTSGYITRIQGTMTKEKGFIQNITLIEKPNWYTYFQIGVSSIGYDDRIAP